MTSTALLGSSSSASICWRIPSCICQLPPIVFQGLASACWNVPAKSSFSSAAQRLPASTTWPNRSNTKGAIRIPDFLGIAAREYGLVADSDSDTDDEIEST